MKSYIIYKGGQYGDLVFSIINNGVHLPAWIQDKLKTDNAKDDINFKTFIDQLPLNIVTGCAAYLLDWGYVNYELVCTDSSINAFSVTRLTQLNANVNVRQVLKSYYSDNIKDSIDNLTEDQATDLLIKKYQMYIINPKVPKSNVIDISCIYNKEKFISNLANYFDFNFELARLQYDQWYERELPLLDKFFKPV
jgi:hypothetical protein